eukprot:c8472_g1_i1.p1 GENE.c8472_g1_i1~~c8472_g1_i1.p1  ORF type:complete len:204 (+),score=80.86 c8472_g1_i1:64-675(+)
MIKKKKRRKKMSEERAHSSSFSSRKPHLLVAITGSMAQIQIKEFLPVLSSWATVRLIFTGRALQSVSIDEVKKLCEVFTDEEEWARRESGSKPLHVELRDWADALVIAPLSANTQAKIYQGICDNLVTSVARAWDFQRPMILSPLMNKEMWDHPLTQKQLQEIQSWGAVVINPDEESLTSGIEGMTNVLDISQKTQDAIRQFG